MTKKLYDVLIIGAGVTGTALLYVLSRYTNIKKIALLEKYETIASVNSNKTNNSQTLHVGDIDLVPAFGLGRTLPLVGQIHPDCLGHQG